MDVAPSLAAKEIHDELQCAICWDILSQPTSLSCGHSFCLEPCLKTLRPSRPGKVKCPTCRAEVRFNEDDASENKTLAQLCSMAKSAQLHACTKHEGKTLSYYCITCDVRICDACAILGDHRGHEVAQLETYGKEVKVTLAKEKERVETARRFAEGQAKRLDSVFGGLASRIDEVADDSIDMIERLRQQAKSALGAQHQKAQWSSDVQQAAARRMCQEVDVDMRTLPQADGLGRVVASFEEKVTSLVPKQTFDVEAKAQAQQALGYLTELSSFNDLQAARTALSTSSGADPLVQVFLQSAKCGSFPSAMLIKLSWTVEQLHTALFDRTGIESTQHCTVYMRGKHVGNDGRTLGQHGVEKGCVLDVRFRWSVLAELKKRKRSTNHGEEDP